MNVLILTGSPKGRKSASCMLGSKLAEGLREHGAAVSDGMVHGGLRSEEGTCRLLDSVDASDLVVFAFPVYVDSLPAPLTRLLERIAERRARGTCAGTPRLAVIVQCGFPESHQCDTAVDICRLFAERTGMRWSGALAMGMGGSVGEDFRKMPGGGRNILDALGMASKSLANGDDIPREATTLFAKPLMPRWMYTLVGNLGWRMQMRKNKARRPLAHRPYSQEQGHAP
ncbi:MAG: NAD(P)H-dependent oxidoreductase [Deltaproteobacteria bacterium]|nr:NAD(P)H-dependent oxidoreductase [Deltaproteobacteria bacterium]